MDEIEYCDECGSEICEHDNCAENCYFGDYCYCFEPIMSLSDVIRQALADREPTHAYK